LLEPWGPLTEAEAEAVFREQVEALVEAGVDGIVLETFSALEEVGAALRAVRKVAPDLPLFASMSFDTGGRTMMGVTPEQAVAFLADAKATVVGANCSVGPEVVEPAIQAMHRERPEVLLLAKPNAGMPQLVEGQPVYPVMPGEMAAFALRVREHGVAIIGGCCGTTPEHIAAMATALRRPTSHP
jgi:methionine synthase I (cobalamin-dependent)